MGDFHIISTSISTLSTVFELKSEPKRILEIFNGDIPIITIVKLTVSLFAHTHQ